MVTVDPYNRALTGLAVQVDRQERRLAELEQVVTRLAEAVKHNTDAIVTLSQPRPTQKNAARVEWLTVSDVEQAATMLSGLAEWVESVWRHYARVPMCWPWHPRAVAELAACWAAWRESVDPGARLSARADWHERYAPGVARRLVPLWAETHVDNCASLVQPEPAEVAAWWV